MQSKRGAALVVLGIHVIVCSWIAVHHEPWRDEADVWLVARDASVGQMLLMAAHSGTPALWGLIVKPFAMLGFPYETMAVLNLLFAEAAVALLLLLAPWPLLVRAAVVFWVPLAYEYPVVARNYALGVMLLFALAALDDQRFKRPVLYGFLVAAMANVSAHFFLFAAVCAAVMGAELILQKRRELAAGLAVASVGALAALVQLWPRPGGQMRDELVLRFDPLRILRALGSAFWGNQDLGLVYPTAALALLAGAWLLSARSPRALALQLGMHLALGYIFACKYFGFRRHHELFLITILYGLWVAAGPRWKTAWNQATPFEIANRLFTVALLMVLSVPLVRDSYRSWRAERAAMFSGSGQVAAYLRESGLDQQVLVGYPAPHASAVLPHLARNTRFFYPAIDAHGTHMWWDKRHVQGLSLPLDDALARNPWLATTPHVLVVGAGRQLSTPGYRLVYETSGRVFATDERYQVYVSTGLAPYSEPPIADPPN